MTLKNALGDVALDATSQDVEKRTGTVAHYLAKLAGAIGLATDPSNGRMRVSVEAGSVAVTTVTTVSAITATNGFGTVAGTNVNPGQQVFAAMTMPALELRNRIVVS